MNWFKDRRDRDMKEQENSDMNWLGDRDIKRLGYELTQTLRYKKTWR